MTSLFTAINAMGATANGAMTNLSSLNKNVDLFFQIGASRGKDITPSFAAALVEDSEVAVRVLEWARDIRGGSGERDMFRTLFGYLIRSEPLLAARVLVKIPDLGRYDDLFIAFGTVLERDALRIITKALTVDHNGLCAKWTPRQGPIANKIRSYMKLNPKQYRKLLVGLSTTVEQSMCARDWTNIEYSHVPSVAAGRYQKAFLKHDPVGYGEYKSKLTTGEVKINAAAVYPYDVIRSLRNGDETVANAQWSALPDYMNGSSDNILAVVDVSGSMAVPVSGSVTALDVALSLGLYTSERLRGAYKDMFITFSGSPKLLKVSGSLVQRMAQMEESEWQMNTDLGKVFTLILDAAVLHKVPESELPKKVIIFSDMEFDACMTTDSKTTAGHYSSGGQKVSVSAIDFIKAKYDAAGYTIPQIVFWNLTAKAGNSPVTYNTVGAALVSGFSPSLLKTIVGSDEMTPLSMMLKTIMTERYDF